MADQLSAHIAARQQQLERTAATSTTLCQQLAPAPTNAAAVPVVSWCPPSTLVVECRAAAQKLAAAMAAYIQRVSQLQEKSQLLAAEVDGQFVVTLSEAARMTKAERKATAHVVMPERGDFKTMLNRRSYRGAQLAASQSYLVRYAEGRYVLHVLRGCITESLSHWHLVFQAVRVHLRPVHQIHTPSFMHHLNTTCVIHMSLCSSLPPCCHRCTATARVDGTSAAAQTSHRMSLRTSTCSGQPEGLLLLGWWMASGCWGCSTEEASLARDSRSATVIPKVAYTQTGVSHNSTHPSTPPSPGPAIAYLPTPSHSTPHPTWCQGRGHTWTGGPTRMRTGRPSWPLSSWSTSCSCTRSTPPHSCLPMAGLQRYPEGSGARGVRGQCALMQCAIQICSNTKMSNCSIQL